MKLFNRKKSKRNKPDDAIYYSNGFFSSAINRSLDENSTAFSAINKIANTIACLNFGVYSKDTREKISDADLLQVLTRPNIDETHYLFFYNSILDYFTGNIYWFVARNDLGNIIALYRLNPSQMVVTRDAITRLKKYHYMGNVYTSNTILHIPSVYSYNGLVGRSIFAVQNKTFKSANKLEEHTENTFSNSWGNNKPIIDVTDECTDLTPKQKEQLREKYIAENTGVNEGKPLIKTSNVKFDILKTGETDNRGQQLLENRNFSEHEVAKLFNIPLALLSPSEKITSNDMEALYTQFKEGCIQPICTHISESVQTLIPFRDRAYFEFNYNSLLKTSLAAKTNNYVKSIGNGLLSPKEARKMENLPPYPGSETYFVPSNLMPATPDIINAYMASAKTKQAELDTNKDSSGIGDDKK